MSETTTSRDAAIEAAADAMCPDREDRCWHQAGVWAMQSLDAAHEAGHITWTDEGNAVHAALAAVVEERDALKAKLTRGPARLQELEAENERLSVILAEAVAGRDAISSAKGPTMIAAWRRLDTAIDRARTHLADRLMSALSPQGEDKA